MDWLDIFIINPGALSNADRVEALAAISQAIAAILSLAALIISLWVFSRQQRLNRWQLRLHREDHIIAWSQTCIALMAEVEEHLKTAGEGPLVAWPNDEFVRLRSRLSALIDEGRLYFPNLPDPVHGKNKQEAYRGHRQSILDRLVEAYDFLRKIQATEAVVPAAEVADKFNDIRRAFVSDVQKAIDPRTFNRIRA